MTILLENGVRPPMGGYSVPSGFFIFGRVSRDSLIGAVDQAYRRMSDGEGQLAISPYCGTNLATGAIIGNLAANVMLKRM